MKVFAMNIPARDGDKADPHKLRSQYSGDSLFESWQNAAVIVGPQDLLA